MSIPCMNWVKGMHRTRIKPSPRTVLRELADFADERDGCWPSVQLICDCTSLSKRAVLDALAVLEEMGLITVQRRHRTSSRYRLNRHLDLTQPALGAPSAPKKPKAQKPSKESSQDNDLSDSSAPNSGLGANGAPKADAQDLASCGADSVAHAVQISSFLGAAAAPQPPKNHQGTTRGRGASARPTPLPPDWQPGEAGEAYARRLGLDPAPLTVRFRKTFLASGKRLADWSQRWELWCDEDAAEKGSAAPTAAPTSAGPSIERDERGLTSSDRGWLAKWQAKIDAEEHPGQLEDMLGRMLSQEGKAELVRLKAALSQTPAKGAEFFRPSQPQRGIIFTRP
ncbi:helix-turn-helix domain-containing protein [Roseomonas aerophila]|uniref:Helix-turn-helix domain-containing protein n=1 Tax=Teichococcus aerophilus TaxID=1224513 RepID=A0ABR7RS36_9PROT|nr:helix-turn-helix domain-containing protein [Pseudoroseomonas aerophila]MBC9208917.1 helix-turn-helix domain-containing protein [Pseudoroseomonas aerophila]